MKGMEIFNGASGKFLGPFLVFCVCVLLRWHHLLMYDFVAAEEPTPNPGMNAILSDTQPHCPVDDDLGERRYV